MYLIRRVQEGDFNQLKSLVLETHLGFTNLPKNEEPLRNIFENALASFQSKSKDPFYLFVLEKDNAICGTAGIYAATAHTEYFHLDRVNLPPLFPEVPPYVSLINRIHYAEGISEIGALFLSAKERKAGVGKLLSLSRFHFMAAFLSRFTKEVYAELRGFITEEGVCPFWEAIGRHFFPVDYAELMHHREYNTRVAQELMPKHPLYLELLAETHLGDTHVNTKPALAMLLKQGFNKTGDFDLYDGGPRVLAEVAKIQTIQESYRVKIQSIVDELPCEPVMISNENLDFRACMGKVDKDKATIDRGTALALKVDSGNSIRCS